MAPIVKSLPSYIKDSQHALEIFRDFNFLRFQSFYYFSQFFSSSSIYCITCTLCKKLYIGETGRRLGDRLQEHLCDVEKDDKDASKPVARHFNLPNHSKEHMSICGLSLHQGTTGSRKNLEQRFIFQIGTPLATTNAFHSINLFLFFT